MKIPTHERPPPLSESVADLPPTLEVAVLKAMDKDPNERFFDFSLFLEVIQSVLSPAPPFPLLLSTTSRKDKTISHPVKSTKAEAISSPIRRWASKRAALRQSEPSGASSSTEDNIATPVVSLSTLDASMPKQVASIPSPETLELGSEVDLVVSSVSESAKSLSEETDDSADQPLHLQKRNEFSATILETTPPFDIFTAEQGIDIHQLAHEEADVSLSPKLFEREATEIVPLEASVDSSHKQDIIGINEKTQLQSSTISLSQPQMVGFSYRKRVLGIALLLSVVIALLASEFWPFETAETDIISHSVQNLVKGVITPIPQHSTAIPTGQSSPQATTQPTMQTTLPLQTPTNVRANADSTATVSQSTTSGNTPSTPPTSTPKPTTPRSYEAESSENTLPSSTSVFGCSRCSGGERVGDVGQSQTLQFNNIEESSAGTYTLTIYYVNGFQHDNGTDMKVNGVDVAQFTKPSTGDWDTPASFTYTVSLNAGDNTILFYYPSTFGFDFDRIVV
ncbi:MAG TPA: hypothetical protein VGL94_04190 [Ktedonobacteraceae bacterium]|jgi:hypothetical protein